ncbi:MAG: GntR family transcriptional regulator [Hominenteromicrobium sp.]
MLYIDYKSGTPIYEQVYNGILQLAALGVLRPGDQLPSVRSVAADAGVNPNTVQKAYAMLERDGVIRSAPGRGSFLAEQSALLDTRRHAALDKLRTAVSEAEQAGVAPAEILETVQKCFEKGNFEGGERHD